MWFYGEMKGRNPKEKSMDESNQNMELQLLNIKRRKK